MKYRMLNLLLLTIALVLMVSCSTVPLTGRKQFVAIPTSQMLALSADSYSQVLAMLAFGVGGERPPEFLSTHPDPSNRIAHINEIMPKAMEYYNAR